MRPLINESEVENFITSSLINHMDSSSLGKILISYLLYFLLNLFMESRLPPSVQIFFIKFISLLITFFSIQRDSPSLKNKE